ncbi:Type II intron maturase, partial [Musa troglodytarum]
MTRREEEEEAGEASASSTPRREEGRRQEEEEASETSTSLTSRREKEEEVGSVAQMQYRTKIFSILDRVLVALATVKLAAMMASSFASADPLLGSARRD